MSYTNMNNSTHPHHPVVGNNFYASDTPERASSVDSVFSDIVATDFVSAVSQLGPDHLVEAMYQAVDSMKVEETSGNSNTNHPANRSTANNSNNNNNFAHQQNHQNPMIFQHQPQNQRQIMLNQQQIAFLTMMMNQLGQQNNNNNSNSLTPEQVQQQMIAFMHNNNNNSSQMPLPPSASSVNRSSSMFVTNDSAPFDHDRHDSRSTSITTTETTTTGPHRQNQLADRTESRKASIVDENTQGNRSSSSSTPAKTKIIDGAVSVPLESSSSPATETQKGLARHANRRAQGKFVETLDSAIEDDNEDLDEIRFRENNDNDGNGKSNSNQESPTRRNKDFTPITTRLKHSPSRRRAAKKSEDLRTTAIVEGSDPAIIAIPARTPKGNNYPSTPSYWNNNGSNSNDNNNGNISSGYRSAGRQHHQTRSSPSASSTLLRSPSDLNNHNNSNNSDSRSSSRFQHNNIPGRPLQTPPVPRPDLDDETELADKELLSQRKRSEKQSITWSEIQSQEAQKQQKQATERNWKTDLKRRVAAVSEHYRRQFAAANNHNNDNDNGDSENHNHEHDGDDDRGHDHASVRRPQTPSETVFKSRAVRMSAAEHNIISASPELHAALDGKPRIRSPYGSLLSVSELDHFLPPVAQTDTAAKLASSLDNNNSNNYNSSGSRRRGNNAIEKTLREGSLEVASRAMHSVDRWTKKDNNNKINSRIDEAHEELSEAQKQRLEEIQKQEDELALFVHERDKRRDEKEKENSIKRYDRNLSNADDIIFKSVHERPGFYAAESNEKRRPQRVELVPGAAAVEVDLEPSRETEEEKLSSPQFASMLSRIMRQKEELAMKSGGGASSDGGTRENNVVMLNEDGTVSDAASRRALFEH